MMLQFAHFGRRCHLSSSVEKDRKLEYRLCRTALQEAEFISEHDYQHADIMMEQSKLLCALICASEVSIILVDISDAMRICKCKINRLLDIFFLVIFIAIFIQHKSITNMCTGFALQAAGFISKNADLM